MTLNSVSAPNARSTRQDGLTRVTIVLTVAMICAWGLLVGLRHFGLDGAPRWALVGVVVLISWLWFWTGAAKLVLEAGRALRRRWVEL